MIISYFGCPINTSLPHKSKYHHQFEGNGCLLFCRLQLREEFGSTGVRALFFPRCFSWGWNYEMLKKGTTELFESELTCKTVVARSTLCPSLWNCGWGDMHPRTWLIHALVPAPLYSPHLLTSVSNYSPVSLAQCLSSESLWKGRGNGCHRNNATNGRSIYSKERVKKGKCRQDFS